MGLGCGIACREQNGDLVASFGFPVERTASGHAMMGNLWRRACVLFHKEMPNYHQNGNGCQRVDCLGDGGKLKNYPPLYLSGEPKKNKQTPLLHTLNGA